MVTRTNRILQAVRDIALLVISVVLMSTSYGKWIDEPAHYVLFGITALLFSLSAINSVLLIRNVQGKRYYYFNAII